MYCPRCSNQAVEGQRYCRNCGMNLGIILDSMEGKPRAPLDFETLKRDLRDLGASLRSGFQEAQDSMKRTHRLGQTAPPPPAQADYAKELQKEIVADAVTRAVRRTKAGDSRVRSMQKATVSILGGGASMAAWYYLLQAFTQPQVVENLERTILQANPHSPDLNLVAYMPVVRLLWVLALIPIAKGVGHLLNGIFFAPKPDPEPRILYVPQQPPPQAAVPAAPAYASAVNTPSTNEFDSQGVPIAPQSVTEDSTLRFDPK